MVKIETKLVKDKDNINVEYVGTKVKDDNGTNGEYLAIINASIKMLINRFNMDKDNILDIIKKTSE